jgi:hypothetical protein
MSFEWESSHIYEEDLYIVKREAVTGNKMNEKALKKSAEKSITELLPWSSTALLVVLVAFAVSVVNLHPPSEGWFSGVATALVTVDGIILGSIILGVTVIAERGLSASLMTPILVQHFESFIENLKVGEVLDSAKLKEKIELAVASALVEITTVPYLLFVAMGCVFASLVIALTLFGFDYGIVSNPLAVMAFKAMLSLSISALVAGFYVTIRVLRDMTTKMDPKKVAKAIEEVLGAVG